MMFVVTELTVLTSTADVVFRSKGMKLNGVQMTVNNLMQELQGTTVRLDRSEMRMFVETPQGKEIDLFEITDALQINPRLLLGYLESGPSILSGVGWCFSGRHRSRFDVRKSSFNGNPWFK